MTDLIAEVTLQLRRLHLPHMRRTAPELLQTAKAQRWDPAEVVRALLAEEIKGRAASSLRNRRKAAAFPTGKTFSTWEEQLSSIPAPTQRALRTLEWIERKENLVVCGPSGTGKSHFLEGLGQQAVEEGRKVSWFSLKAIGPAGSATPHRPQHRPGDRKDPAGRSDRHRRHWAIAGRRGGRRGVLPAHRRCLRASLDRALVQSASGRI